MSAIKKTHSTSDEEPQKTKPADDVWQISIWDEKVQLARLENGKTVESYRHTDKLMALTNLGLIIQGYQPVRFPRHLDKPSD